MGWRVCDSSSATTLVSVGFWPHLQNRTSCLPVPSPPLCPPTPTPPPSISQLLRLESSARVYFHGWGVKTALSLFWLPCRSQWRRRGVLRIGAGPHGGHVEDDGGEVGGWVSRYGSLSNGVRGQLQQGGCQRGGHVTESDLCAFRYGDVRIFHFPSLAMDGTEISIHQLHDLSQL